MNSKPLSFQVPVFVTRILLGQTLWWCTCGDKKSRASAICKLKYRKLFLSKFTIIKYFSLENIILFYSIHQYKSKIMFTTINDSYNTHYKIY